MKTIKIAFCILAMIVLSTCSSMKPLEVKFREIKADGFYSTSAATKSTIVRGKNDQRIICTEPAPDAAFDEDDNASLGFSFLHIGDKTSEAASDGETEGGLGGRSVNVLLTRVMYFRMCEFFANTNFPDSVKIEIYNATLQSILKLNGTNFGTGTRSGSTSQGIFNETGSLLPTDSLATDSSATKTNDNNSDDNNGW